MLPASTAPARIEHLDALRGLALFGIAMVNVGVFASPWWGLGTSDPGFAAPLDRAVDALVAMVFEMKFYLLFSFLFGYNFSLQLSAARRAGEAFAPRMGRRLLGLWAIGLAHALLLFHGDILTTYALMGALLLAMHQAPEALAVRRANRLLLLTAAAWAGFAVLVWIDGASAGDAAAVAPQARAALIRFSGDPGEVLSARVDALWSSAWVIAGLQAPCALAMFLYGMIAGRRQILARVDHYQPLLRTVRRWGLAIGLPAAALFAAVQTWAPGGALELFALALSIVTAPLLCLAYVAVAMRVFAGRGGARIARALAPAGRMALSNYLLQSFVLSLLFTGYGLGLMGRMSPLGCVAVVAVLYGAQLWLSDAWLRRHAYGPVEWLLRAITIGAWPRAQAAAYPSR
ncbi:DUF418 domain-containing protein [Lysobacter gummosus]|uniref:DUF418 domain-containing protein n=1 Tax=Lysobacter gummosus TaxID=262324 RepID=UPI00362F09CE